MFSGMDEPHQGGDLGFAWPAPCCGFAISCEQEQVWRSGESTCLPPMWPWFKSRRRRPMWVEFVVGSLPCSESFFSGYSGFPLSSKTNISKFQFDQESGRRRTTMWMCYLQIVIYLFIYLFICNKVNVFIYSSVLLSVILLLISLVIDTKDYFHH